MFTHVKLTWGQTWSISQSNEISKFYDMIISKSIFEWFDWCLTWSNWINSVLIWYGQIILEVWHVWHETDQSKQCHFQFDLIWSNQSVIFIYLICFDHVKPMSFWYWHDMIKSVVIFSSFDTIWLYQTNIIYGLIWLDQISVSFWWIWFDMILSNQYHICIDLIWFDRFTEYERISTNINTYQCKYQPIFTNIKHISTHINPYQTHIKTFDIDYSSWFDVIISKQYLNWNDPRWSCQSIIKYQLIPFDMINFKSNTNWFDMIKSI